MNVDDQPWKVRTVVFFGTPQQGKQTLVVTLLTLRGSALPRSLIRLRGSWRAHIGVSTVARFHCLPEVVTPTQTTDPICRPYLRDGSRHYVPDEATRTRYLLVAAPGQLTRHFNNAAAACSLADIPVLVVSALETDTRCRREIEAHVRLAHSQTSARALIVAITKLDLVAPKERREVFESVKDEVTKIVEGLSTFAIHAFIPIGLEQNVVASEDSRDNIFPDLGPVPDSAPLALFDALRTYCSDRLDNVLPEDPDLPRHFVTPRTFRSAGNECYLSSRLCLGKMAVDYCNLIYSGNWGETSSMLEVGEMIEAREIPANEMWAVPYMRPLNRLCDIVRNSSVESMSGFEHGSYYRWSPQRKFSIEIYRTCLFYNRVVSNPGAYQLKSLERCWADLTYSSTAVHQGGHYTMISHGGRVRVRVRYFCRLSNAIEKSKPGEFSSIGPEKTTDAISTATNSSSASNACLDSALQSQPAIARVLLEVVPGQYCHLALLPFDPARFPECLSRFCLADHGAVQATGVVRQLLLNSKGNKVDHDQEELEVDPLMTALLEYLRTAPPTSLNFSCFSWLPSDVIQYILGFYLRLRGHSQKKARRKQYVDSRELLRNENS